MTQWHSQLQWGPQAGGLGARRIALLEAIAATGSISAAARRVGLSYKGAWDAVNAVNNLSAAPMVTPAAGGAGGGGTQLTERGRRLIAAFRAAEREQQRFMQRLNQRLEHLDADDIHLMERLAMHTSARNQLVGTVAGIASGPVNAEIDIDLPGGDRLTAVITRASVDNLGLAEGLAVTALIKASWVILAAGDRAGAGWSARNRLVGRVEAITRDAVDAEVILRLPGGTTLAAVVTRESADAMALAEGATVTALFKASSVILAQAG